MIYVSYIDNYNWYEMNALSLLQIIPSYQLSELYVR